MAVEIQADVVPLFNMRLLHVWQQRPLREEEAAALLAYISELRAAASTALLGLDAAAGSLQRTRSCVTDAATAAAALAQGVDT